MTRFGWVMTTYVAVLGIGADGAVPSGAQADLERQRQRADRPLCRASRRRVARRRVAGGDAAGAARHVSRRRRYLPKGVPLLKHVLALPGQTVCRSGRTITVDGVAMGDSARPGSSGPPAARLAGLPRHRRRRCLPDEPAVRGLPSTAGISARCPPPTIVGRADPLWTDEEH